MELLNFMNTNPLWETILTQEPYNLKIKHENGYVIIKYNIGAGFSYTLSKEARGAIFKKTEKGKYICVCHPFDKFFNYGEIFADNINWEKATVQEKVDGSLIKVWYDNEWHISTNGCVNAFEAATDKDSNFGEVFTKALIKQSNGACKDVNDFFAGLDKTHVYMFELVSPDCQLVVYYPEEALYYIGERDMTTDKELYRYTDYMKNFGIKKPKIYHLNNLNDVIELVNSFDDSEEGCVVCDDKFRRIKVKGQAYLAAFTSRCQMCISDRRIVLAIQNETIDDWAAYNPAIKEREDRVFSILREKGAELDAQWKVFYREIVELGLSSRKEIAAYINGQYKESSVFLFNKLGQPTLTGCDFVLKQRPTVWLRYIKEAR